MDQDKDNAKPLEQVSEESIEAVVEVGNAQIQVLPSKLLLRHFDWRRLLWPGPAGWVATLGRMARTSHEVGPALSYLLFISRTPMTCGLYQALGASIIASAVGYNVSEVVSPFAQPKLRKGPSSSLCFRPQRCSRPSASSVKQFLWHRAVDSALLSLSTFLALIEALPFFVALRPIAGTRPSVDPCGEENTQDLTVTALFFAAMVIRDTVSNFKAYRQWAKRWLYVGAAQAQKAFRLYELLVAQLEAYAPEQLLQLHREIDQRIGEEGLTGENEPGLRRSLVRQMKASILENADLSVQLGEIHRAQSLLSHFRYQFCSKREAAKWMCGLGLGAGAGYLVGQGSMLEVQSFPPDLLGGSFMSDLLDGLVNNHFAPIFSALCLTMMGPAALNQVLETLKLIRRFELTEGQPLYGCGPRSFFIAWALFRASVAYLASVMMLTTCLALVLPELDMVSEFGQAVVLGLSFLYGIHLFAKEWEEHATSSVLLLKWGRSAFDKLFRDACRRPYPQEQQVRDNVKRLDAYVRFGLRKWAQSKPEEVVSAMAARRRGGWTPSPQLQHQMSELPLTEMPALALSAPAVSPSSTKEQPKGCLSRLAQCFCHRPRRKDSPQVELSGLPAPPPGISQRRLTFSQWNPVRGGENKLAKASDHQGLNISLA